MLPLVSVTMPTYERSDRHALAYSQFDCSRYPNKELLVLDDSLHPSPFFSSLADPRVVYLHSRLRMSVGAKRNELARRARGFAIVHQDDDDTYAPEYISAMVSHLWNADFVKLSVFNVLDERTSRKWQWDTRLGLASNDVTRWGYGFSYVYRRSLLSAARFPDVDRREDYGFVRQIRRVGARLKQVSDYADLVWHTIHGSSTSVCFPQIRLSDVHSEVPALHI
jgi:glycosyltransferase involved in cell wall biosynthesis